MAVSDNLNLNATPAVTPYVDELMLSPQAGQSNNSSIKPTPELMISPTPAPQPSLDIYKDQNSIKMNLTPTPTYVSGTPGNLSNVFLWILMGAALVAFVTGIIVALKNNFSKK